MITQDIIGLFAEELGRELTINQISKKLKKSYASINSHARNLISKGILNKKDVGSAILCSLNYENNEVIGYLILNSMSKSKNMPEKFNKDSLLCAFKLDDKTYCYSISEKIKGCENFDRNNFKKIVKNNLGKIMIIKGYEVFWNLVRDVMT